MEAPNASRLVPRFSWQRVLVALAGVFGVLVALGLRYYGHYHPFADLIGGVQHGPPPATLRIADATVTGRTDGRLRWRIEARAITLSQDRSQVTVQGIHNGVFLAPTGTPLFALQAGQVTYQKPFGMLLLDSPGSIGGGGLVTVSGGIIGHALRPGGPTLSSASLTWDILQNQVRSLGSTVARFPSGAHAVSGMTLRADALVWNTASDTLSAPGTVTATFADGVGQVQGQDISVDARQGTLTLHHLHGTFRIPDTVN